jgi:hypothetical protein
VCDHSFWDSVFIKELLDDRVARNLLYIEALSCVTQGQWEVTDDIKKQLSQLQRKSHKKEVCGGGACGGGWGLSCDLSCNVVGVQYLELAGNLLQFGFIQLDGLTLDHPTEDLTGTMTTQ